MSTQIWFTNKASGSHTVWIGNCKQQLLKTSKAVVLKMGSIKHSRWDPWFFFSFTFLIKIKIQLKLNKMRFFSDVSLYISLFMPHSPSIFVIYNSIFVSSFVPEEVRFVLNSYIHLLVLLLEPSSILCEVGMFMCINAYCLHTSTHENPQCRVFQSSFVYNRTV